MAANHVLNVNHRRVLLIGFAHIDRLLSDVVREIGSRSPFSRLAADLQRAELQAVEEYVRTLRRQLIEGLAELGIDPPRPEATASSSLATATLFAQVALYDMDPRRLIGYGPLDPEAGTIVERIETDSARTLAELKAYLARAERRALAPAAEH